MHLEAMCPMTHCNILTSAQRNVMILIKVAIYQLL